MKEHTLDAMDEANTGNTWHGKDESNLVVSEQSGQIQSQSFVGSAIGPVATSEGRDRKLFSRRKNVSKAVQKIRKSSGLKEQQTFKDCHSFNSDDEGDRGAVCTGQIQDDEHEEEILQLQKEMIEMDPGALRKDVRRTLDLLGVGDYDLTMHYGNELGGDWQEPLETILRMGNRSRIIAGLQCALKNDAEYSVEFSDGYKLLLDPSDFEHLLVIMFRASPEDSVSIGPGYKTQLRWADVPRLPSMLPSWAKEKEYTANDKVPRILDIRDFTMFTCDVLDKVYSALLVYEQHYERKTSSVPCLRPEMQLFFDSKAMLRELLFMLFYIKNDTSGPGDAASLFDTTLFVFSAALVKQAEGLIAQVQSNLQVTYESILEALESHQSSHAPETLHYNDGGHRTFIKFDKETASLLRDTRECCRKRLKKEKCTPLESITHLIAEFSTWFWGRRPSFRPMVSKIPIINYHDYFGYAFGEELYIPIQWLLAESVRNKVSAMAHSILSSSTASETSCNAICTRCILKISPGWEAPLPVLYGGVSHGKSEHTISNLAGQLRSKIRRAFLEKTCVFVKLLGGILILAPQTKEAHLLMWSRYQFVGHLGPSTSTKEQNLSEIVRNAERKDSGRFAQKDNFSILSMKISQDRLASNADNLIMEYGDLLHCFRGTYLVCDSGGLWYIVPNPRWKRIWSLVKKVSQSVRPTAITAFMISVTWKYVDTSTNTVNRAFWGREFVKKSGTLLTGSASVVEALSKSLRTEGIERLGGEMIATVAQEYLASCPSIWLRVDGPKRCWSMLCDDPSFGDTANKISDSDRKNKVAVLDYWAESGHKFRGAVLRFGSVGEQLYVRIANRRKRRWIKVEDCDPMNRTMHVGECDPSVKPEQHPPAKDDSWGGAWIVGGKCVHK